MERKSIVERKTKETDISISLSLDGTGKSDIHTGIGFFDHMLEGFARHGFFDLKVNVMGDLEVDGHHTVEDTGIVLGQAIKEALGSKTGIRRYGSCHSGRVLLFNLNYIVSCPFSETQPSHLSGSVKVHGRPRARRHQLAFLTPGIWPL